MKRIPLTQGKFALVDDEDFLQASKHRWFAAKMGRMWYAARQVYSSGKQKTQLLHMFLLPGTPRIDHRDGDGLNNRRGNLRPATRAQNAQGFRHKAINSSSKFRGVYRNKRLRKWQATLGRGGSLIHLGLFISEEAAARAYDRAAREFFGEFAHLNFPREGSKQKNTKIESKTK